MYFFRIHSIFVPDRYQPAVYYNGRLWTQTHEHETDESSVWEHRGASSEEDYWAM